MFWALTVSVRPKTHLSTRVIPGRMRALLEMTMEDVRAAASDPDTVVILVIGAVEEHGAHLPVGADIFQPLDVARRVSERTGAVVAPAVPYGVCGSTRGFPGTLTVTFSSLRSYVRDILFEMVRTGFRKVMLLSGHAGGVHMTALRLAAQEVVDAHPGVVCAVLSDYDHAYEIITEMEGMEGDGHSGEIETSRMMAVRPDLVRKSITEGSEYPDRRFIHPNPEEVWSGVRGDARRASPGLGNRVNDHVVEMLCRLVDEMRGREGTK